MSRESITVARLATTTPNRFIRVSVNYTKGGTSYFTGTHKGRGYSIHFTPIEDHGDGSWSTMLMSGICHHFEDANRFNRKRLEQLASNPASIPMYKECLDKVLAEERLTLADEAKPQEIAA